MHRNTCKHENTTEGNPYGYRGSVAVHPYTMANPAAAGGCCIRETCRDCGSARQVNSNGRHREYGPWGPSRVAQEEQARREAEAERAEGARLAHAERLLVVRLDGWYALVRRAGIDGADARDEWVEREAIRAAAEGPRREQWQSETPEARRIRLIYGALQRQVEELAKIPEWSHGS